MKSFLNTKTKWGLGAIFIIATLIFLIAIDSLISRSLSKNISYGNTPGSANVGSVESLNKTEDPPKYFYFTKNEMGEPKISAQAYLVGDLHTGEVILSKNQEQKFPTASISKLMTAFVATKIIDKDDIAEASKRALATYGGNGNLQVGEKIKTTDLFYPLLLESSNDAAEIIAEHFGRDGFLRRMNQEAERLTMTSTFYEDPSGLSVKNTSTAADLFKLAGILNKEKPDLLSITTKRSYSNKKHNWSSTNQFLREEGYIGGKSGYTDPAQETAVSLFSVPLGESGTRPIAIVLLHSTDRYKDATSILKYLKRNIYYGGKADANNDWVKEKVGLPDIKDSDFVSFAFLGDIMLDRGVKNSVIKNFNGDYSTLFEKLAILKKSDVVFANLEGTASDQGRDLRNLYSFRMDPAVIPALAGGGINILSVASNHVGDWGREAYIDTLSRLRENEILYTGGGMESEEAEQPVVMDKYGIKLGFLGFLDKGPDWMKATENASGLLFASNPRFGEIIENASRQVDYLIVSFHFGEEYQSKHDSRQEYLAHRAVDNGAKLVIGSHPHVVQDFEVYKNSYIAYSLGNFIFDQNFSKDTMKGMLLEIKLGRDGSITTKKNVIQLNSAFQPDQVIQGTEEKIKFQ